VSNICSQIAPLHFSMLQLLRHVVKRFGQFDKFLVPFFLHPNAEVSTCQGFSSAHHIRQRVNKPANPQGSDQHPNYRHQERQTAENQSTQIPGTKQFLVASNYQPQDHTQYKKGNPEEQHSAKKSPGHFSALRQVRSRKMLKACRPRRSMLTRIPFVLEFPGQTAAVIEMVFHSRSPWNL
jgi:hypothetical protein